MAAIPSGIAWESKQALSLFLGVEEPGKGISRDKPEFYNPLPMDHKHWRGHVFDKSRWIPFLIELLIVHLLIQEKSAQLSDWEEELICLQRIAHGVEDSIVSYITSDIVDVRIHVVHERGSKTCTHGTDLLSTKICLIRMRINVRPSVHYVLQWVAVPIPTDRLLKHLAKATGSVEVCC